MSRTRKPNKSRSNNRSNYKPQPTQPTGVNSFSLLFFSLSVLVMAFTAFTSIIKPSEPSTAQQQQPTTEPTSVQQASFLPEACQ